MKSTKKSFAKKDWNTIYRNKYLINFSPLFRAVSLIFYQLLFGLVLPFNIIFYNLSVRGRRHLRNERGFLVSNHTLYLDPGIIGQALYPRRAYFSVLQETFRIPGLALMIRVLGAFPLPEENPFKKLLVSLEKVIEGNGLVHFFPEGKLYPRNQNIREFKMGVFFFAFHFDLPVIPLTTVIKKRRLFGREFSFLPPKITVIIGKPIYPDLFRSPGVKLREQIASMAEYVRMEMQKTIDREHGRS